MKNKTRKNIIHNAKIGRMIYLENGKIYKILQRPKNMSFTGERDFDIIGPEGKEWTLNLSLSGEILIPIVQKAI